MASKRHEIRRVQAASRRMTGMEVSVAACVLIGLLFVSFRVIGAPRVSPPSQQPAPIAISGG